MMIKRLRFPFLLMVLLLTCLLPSAAETSSPAEGTFALEPAVTTATFNQMLGLYPVPGAPDEALVLTQDGDIWRVSISSAFAPAAFADLSGRILVTGSEEGLLGLAFSPQYNTDGEVYVYYNAPPSSPDFYAREVLSRFQVAGNALDLGSEEILISLDDPGFWHNGGQLAFGPDGYLYLAIGDGGYRDGVWYWDNGQDLTNMFGSIIRIDVSAESGYSIPPDNPFTDGPGGNADEIYAYGFRNPWRFSFDGLTGNLWVGDVGQWNWEEVDHVVMGGNYGWNVMEGFWCFNVSDPDDCDKSPYALPRAVYCHDEYVPDCPTVDECAIIGGFVYRGTALPDLYGWYVYGDFCSGRIWAVDTSSDSSPPVTLTDSAYLITSFAELPGGELLVVTRNNAIYRLTCAATPDTDDDGQGDSCDLDDDNDGWTDAAEVVIGTDALDACSDNSLDNAWPADLNNDTFSDGTDITILAGSFNRAVPPAPPRRDIAPAQAPDGFVDGTDITVLAAFFNNGCGP